MIENKCETASERVEEEQLKAEENDQPQQMQTVPLDLLENRLKA